MHPLDRGPSITSQAFNAVEQSGVSCSRCTAIPIISALGSVVYVAARSGRCVYECFRRNRSRAAQNNAQNEQNGTLDPGIVEVRLEKKTQNTSDSEQTIDQHRIETDLLPNRHVTILLRQNSDNQIIGIDINDVRD